MQDPIGSFERIREFYLAYLDTAFRIRDPEIRDERRDLLRRPGTLCTEPLLEPIPRYTSDALGFAELLVPTPGDPLTGFSERERLAFVELVLAGLFPSRARSDDDAREHAGLSRIPKFKPYSHQMEMLRRGVKVGTPGIVTSGTGSGKTESFLLPLLASIVREGTEWQVPEPGYLARRWWHGEDGRPYRKNNRAGHEVISFSAIPRDRRPEKKAATRSPFRAHRAGERRVAAVRALILYPMNALVEDQLVRLRKALDSSEARSAMDTHLNGNRIFFGRYTGATPVTGHHLHPGLQRLLEADPKSLGDECVYFPDHKDADADGKVRLTDVRQAEFERRKRRLEELFDHMVDAEEGQRAARLHAVERRAQAEMSIRFPAGTSAEPRAIVQAMVEIGGLSRASAWELFENLAGREPNDQEAADLEPSLLREEAAQRAASSTGDDAPFMFPATDGSELVSRWDMQEHPPDILITNVSMLSAMLNREVDAPIFDKTRAWLREPNAYFYLVMDELHLQRGAAGTEVAYLLRLLFQRLGLTESPEQLAKVRVLASSASLPAAPTQEAERSSAYLWDMFGRYGLADSVVEPDRGRHEWLESIVPGTERQGRYTEASPPPSLDPTPFRALMTHYQRDEVEPAAADTLDPVAEDLWREGARALGVRSTLPLPELLRETAHEISERLAFACWESSAQSGRTRATALSRLRERLFPDTSGDPSQSLRPFLFARGAAQHLAKAEGTASTFRLHTFFRSLEGLYAPAVKAPRTVGALSIEREPRTMVHTADGEQEARLFELVYCECCGELFFGGLTPDEPSLQRTPYVAELLPHEPHLDGLPDRSASQRFEDLSWQQHRLFWPTDIERTIPQDEDDGEWILAALEIGTGGIKRITKGLGRGVPLDVVKADPGCVLGFYYERKPALDRHGRRRDSAGTNVPYACPRCQTSYSQRTKESRLSPLRNFRAGFGKTTQLLATELFDAQRNASPDPAKLVAFSDSRQDAARGALSIERGHHQDIRRELLVLCLTSARRRIRSTELIQQELEAIERDIRGRMAARQGFADLESAFRGLHDELREQAETSIPLAAILEGRSLADVTGVRPVLPFIAEHVRKGIHPFDEAGTQSVRGQQDGEDHWFKWEHLFESSPHEVRWRDDERRQTALEVARQELVQRVYRSLTEVVFSKTYFSFEEAGQGFVTISRRGAEPVPQGGRDVVLESAGLLRVLADCYRYDPSPYRKDDAEYFAPWSNFAEVGAKVKRYAEASWPADPSGALQRALQELGEHGHRDGVVSVRQIRLQLANDDDSYLRCRNCGRVHLHVGTGVCTRCFAALGNAEVGLVRELRSTSFLGRRVSRALRQAGASFDTRGVFRLHCEELTGQTDDPATRQREFKGIFVPDWTTDDADDGEPHEERLVTGEDRAFRAKKEIDLLTVTTTMEVGIDIGPLQVVMQANMPPQRFNYQQRVGRAGRRGQAFSMALTICRTRSHDLYYFRHPEKMTGDVPPTPFLTKDMSNIADRFLRKAWLVEAFGSLRASLRINRGIFPGDLMSPPDIHGEFLPSCFWPEAAGDAWRTMVEAALRSTEPTARAIRRALDDAPQAPASDDVVRMIGDIDRAVQHDREPGLAHTLAERGLLPMYGMPTRVRRLYLGLRAKEGEVDWDYVDRDIDLAIYEFAPGSVTVRDKQEHLAVGLTPDLAPPRPGRQQAVQEIKVFQEDRPWGPEFYLVECNLCRAWKEIQEVGEDGRLCDSCGGVLSVEPMHLHRCWIPNAFRTNFRPKPSQEDSDAGTRHRSIQAEGKALDFRARLLSNGGCSVEFDLAFDETARTYRLNRGGGHENENMGFDLEPGAQRMSWGRRNYLVPKQAVSVEARLQKSIQTFESAGEPVRVWLAAAKTTDSMFLAPARNPDGLALYRLPGRAETATPLFGTIRWLGVRAAALSAAYLLASRAALELDIDPEEFDVLEPRMYGSDGQRPILQITDHLVNGAGFTKALCTGETEATPLVAHLLRSMLNDTAEYPLREFLDDAHARCDTACYRCLLRYGNQPFHGILDWQLGLAYLRAMTDPGYGCGLGGSFEGAEIERWPALATRLARTMADRFEGEFGTFEELPAFRIRLRGGGMSRWVLVAHPLWDWDEENGAAPGTLLARAAESASEHGMPLCWDTFNLSRRQVRVREWVRGAG